MKKIILGAAVLAAMMATSCQNEELVASQEQGNVVVKASTMNKSRTYVQGRTIYWSEGDGLLAYGEDVLGSLSLVDGVGSTNGEFAGYVSGDVEDLEYLVYPAEMASYKDGKVTIEIGTINKAKSNAPMFAHWGSNVTFEQLTGMVRIQINNVPAKNNDLEVIGMGIGTAVFEDGNINPSKKNNTIKVTGLTVGSNEICIPVFTKNTTAQNVDLTFKLAGATKVLNLPLAQKALTATSVPVLNYDAVNKTLDEDTTLPEAATDEFKITNLTELYQFANLVKEGNTYEGKTVTLGADIDLDNMPWSPISGFKGTFNGNNKTISNLYVAVEGKASAGLFANGILATVKDLKLQNVDVNGNYMTGAIVGDGSCVTIENCQVIGGTVTSTPHVVNGNNDDGNHAGGIVGYLAADGGNASVKNCTVDGLTITAYRDVAGIAGTTSGKNDNTITGCSVSNTTIIADQTIEYVETKAANAGEFVGRQETTPTMSDNTVGEGVNVEIRISQVDDLKMAIKTKNSNIKLAEGEYELSGFSLAEGVTITGENKDNVILKGYLTSTINNVTIKDVVIEGSNTQRWAYATGTLFFENCTFNAKGVYALHFDGITDADITYKDCKIIGWVAITGGAKSLTFDGCEIIGNGTYGVIRTYGDATIKNCHFDVDNVNKSDVYQDGIHAVDCNVIVEKCVNVNGELENLFNVSGTGKIEVR